MTQQDAPVAECELVLVFPDGRRSPGRIALYAPQVIDEREAQCRVVLDGLHEIEAPISGNDRLPALLLALRRAAQLLEAFEEGGGKLEYPTGEPFELEPYFGGLLRRLG